MRPENFTRDVYTLINEENYAEVVRILAQEQQAFPDSTAIHSLLGWCYWKMERFEEAGLEYEKLVKLNPKNDEYKLTYAQCLYRTAKWYDAARAISSVQTEPWKTQAQLLLAAVRYAEEDLQSSKSLLQEQDAQDMDVMLDQACILYKEERFEDALERYLDVKRTHGFSPQVAYCIALCYYRLNRLPEVVQLVTEIKTQAARQHPELLRSMSGEAVDFDGLGLIKRAQEAYLVEAMNLSCAVHFDQKRVDHARDALQELPSRNEDDLDPVTLHNKALVQMEDNPQAAFRKLTFLLSSPEVCPAETFHNLLLGYCRFEYWNYASDMLAEHHEEAVKTMGQQQLDFLHALLLQSSSREEAWRKFDDLCKISADQLRRLQRDAEDARRTHDEAASATVATQFEAGVGTLIPVLMSQAKILWDMDKYELAELLLLKYADFCQEDRTWKMNLGHIYFMQQQKMADAIQLYEPLVHGETNICDVEAILVANLCVAYVTLNQNESADTLINRVTDEETAKLKSDPNSKIYHLSIIHLVIGTLYCAHKNFDFGIDYVLKAFVPMGQKLNADTWFYAKKCIFELIRVASLRQFVISDALLDKILKFLDEVAVHGKGVDSILDLAVNAEDARETQSIAFEARAIKALLLKMIHF